MSGIRRSLLTRPTTLPTAKDRELVDFSRFPFISNNQAQPVLGVAFSRVLEIATEVSHKEVKDLVDIKSVAQLQKIRRLVREEWIKQQTRKLE